MNDFDNRIRYIMSHRNALLGNLKWSELDSVIYACVGSRRLRL
jgi:hypothetical protein